MWLLSAITCAFVRQTEEDKVHRGEGSLKIKVQTGRMQPQPRNMSSQRQLDQHGIVFSAVSEGNVSQVGADFGLLRLFQASALRTVK